MGRWLNPDLFLVNVLLKATLIVLTVVVVLISGYPLVFLLLLLDVILGLLHVNEDLFELLLLHLLICLDLFAFDIISDDILGKGDLLDLEVNDSSAHLHGLGQSWGKRESLSDEYECPELRHVILKIEPVIFEPDYCMTSRNTDVIDAQVRVMPSAESD